jgi:two-component system NtrC family sensor kinase
LIQSEKLAGIGTLAAGVAHEVSSPLFGILGLAEAIPDEEIRTQVDEYAREIVGYCHSIREIVVDLSGYSRASHRDRDEAIDLGGCIQDAHRLVGRALQIDGVNVELFLADGLSVQAKPTEITQIFVNLLKNAVEAVRDEHPTGGGSVVVTTKREIDHIWITVADNGVGIAEDIQGRVFDPFYTTKPPGKGTGLGLNVVYRIVTKYRGTIGVERRVEGGTMFYIRFPYEA